MHQLHSCACNTIDLKFCKINHTAGVDDLCTARAAISQQTTPAAGCRVVAHRRLPGVDDDFYTARAAISQPAPTGCWVVAHRRLAGVDDLYTARAAIRQPAPAG